MLARRFPELDIVMGPQYANRISELLEAVADGHQVVATEPVYQMEDEVLPRRKSDVTAWVNVIYGCNERCTYCVVPNTRGVEQSRTLEAIVGEIAQLVALGYREVTLLGQNVDSWGRDMTPKQKFADLLTAAGNVPGIERVRFLTSHPKYMSERVIAAVASTPTLMPCFNIPFQSGDDDVLRSMRRGYTRQRFLDIVHSIRAVLPDAAITTDCIVGFPGETEEQFLRTLSFMEEVKFEQVSEWVMGGYVVDILPSAFITTRRFIHPFPLITFPNCIVHFLPFHFFIDTLLLCYYRSTPLPTLLVPTRRPPRGHRNSRKTSSKTVCSASTASPQPTPSNAPRASWVACNMCWWRRSTSRTLCSLWDATHTHASCTSKGGCSCCIDPFNVFCFLSFLPYFAPSSFHLLRLLDIHSSISILVHLSLPSLRNFSELKGKTVPVRILEARPYSLTGEMVTEAAE